MRFCGAALCLLCLASAANAQSLRWVAPVGFTRTASQLAVESDSSSVAAIAPAAAFFGAGLGVAAGALVGWIVTAF